ncbi:restriction endonuclease subunit S [Nostoc sp. 2RC]|uniref:restriction endonuclease subunit S n=1 Tax=Nostoc sp. 2RC TaxID=2485484 RepID=UPI00162AEC1A|nr:restriction endonuclease subunit S [Nostoc sp. 2RC]MBC1236861.1 restriction endonuclease subunit S [Nostoc sp. 2RC]
MVPNGWKIVNIENIATVKGGRRMPKGRPFAEEVTPYPYIRVSDFKDGSIRKDNLKYVLPNDREQIKHYTISSQDIYISIAGTIGLVGTVPRELDGAQLTENAAKISIKNPKNIDINFLKYVLSSKFVQNQIEQAKGIGGGVPKLAIFRIEKITILLPTISEQKKIAEILSSLDEAIASTQAVIDQTRKVKQGLLQQLLTRGIGHTKFKESAIGKIPVNWEVEELAKVARVIDCKHRTPEYVESGFPVVRPRDVKEGALDLSGCLRTTKEDYEDLIENHCPSVGDIIYSRNATFGVAAIVETNELFTVGQDVCIIVGQLLIGRLLFYLLNSRIIKTQIDKLSAGSTFQRINLKDIRRFLVPVIAEDEQKEIAAIADSVTEEIKTLETQLHHLQTIKNGLMQDLLTGRVRVTNI